MKKIIEFATFLSLTVIVLGSCGKEANDTRGGNSSTFTSFEGKYFFIRGLPSAKLNYSMYEPTWNYFKSVPLSELQDYILNFTMGNPSILEFSKNGEILLNNTFSCYYKYDLINKTLLTCSEIECTSIPRGVAPIYNYLPNERIYFNEHCVLFSVIFPLIKCDVSGISNSIFLVKAK